MENYKKITLTRHVMKPLYAIISTCLLGILPFHSNASPSGNASEDKADTSNLLFRTDKKYNLREQFGYDGLNRLVKYGVDTASYAGNGNLLSRSETGTFSYGLGAKPYALTGMNTESGIASRSPQEISYTSFSRPATIGENGKTATFTYNADYDRVRMAFGPLASGATRSVYYLGGNFESVYTSSSTIPVEERLYLGGGYYDAPAVYVKKNGKRTLYYILRDYLGSIVAVADESGNVVERNSFDAWGNQRDPQTHEVYDAGEAPALMLGRGFTGHEHLQQFGLINMNARLYDPALGRFLSPDPYVQSECGPQGFNRYSYCLNNPLCYVDKDGEFPILLAGALIGGAVNLVYKACSGQIHSAGDAFFAFGIGAMAGITGVATGGWAFGAAGGAALGGGGFLAGAAAGGLGSAAETFVQGLGNNLYFGDPMVSAKDLLIGSAIGAFAGGVINGSVAASESKNFWTGDMIAEGRGTFSINNSPKRVFDFPERTEINFKNHYNSHNRHADLNISDTQALKNTKQVINKFGYRLGQGDNTLIGQINGVDRSFKIFIEGNTVKSINIYVGFSNRTNLRNPILNYGKLKW